MNLNKMKKAYEIYNLNTDIKIERNILNYIEKRLVINEEMLNKIIEYTKVNITYENILKTFLKESEKESLYKKERNVRKTEDGFIKAEYTVPVGCIVVETIDVLEMLSYFIKSIKSRNCICISNMDYNENSIENALFIIFREALKKYNLDEELINILPYEECYYEEFDLIIKDNEIEKIKTKKKDKICIYKEDDYFSDVIEKEIMLLEEDGKEVVIFNGNTEDVIEKINKENVLGAVIYTKDNKLGYRFINLVHADNAFVNSTLIEAKSLINENNDIYTKKHIMYPIK